MLDYRSTDTLRLSVFAQEKQTECSVVNIEPLTIS